MKARLIKDTGRLSGPEFYAIEVELADGEKFVLRLADHEYSRLASRLTGIDEPNHINPQMALVLGHIAKKITDPIS